MARRAGPVVGQEVVGEEDCEGLVAHGALGAEDGVAEAELLGLAHEDALHASGQDVADHGRLCRLSPARQQALEFGVGVEVVLDGALVAPGDEDEGVNPRLHRLLGGVLDEGLVDDGQEFLRHGLRGGQEARPEARDGEDGAPHGSVFRRHLVCTSSSSARPASRSSASISSLRSAYSRRLRSMKAWVRRDFSRRPLGVRR